MPRLYRPTIPIAIKCLVVLRQLGEIWPDDLIKAYRGMMHVLLSDRLAKLACTLMCDVSDLRLDHDPPLGARKKRGEGKQTIYTPAANDPDHLRYRPHGTQFEGSHDTKTRLRGDHGQYCDLTLIKRERKRQKKEREKSPPSTKMRSRSRFASGKRPWPKRKFR